MHIAKRYSIWIGIAVLLSLGLTAELWLEKTKDTRSATVEVPSDANNLQSSAPPKGHRVPGGNNFLELKAQLATQGKNAWRQVLSHDFSGLSVSDIWDLVNSPDISDQLQSKLTRDQLARACINSLSELDSGGSLSNSKSSALSVACAKLHEVVSLKDLASNAMKLQTDLEYLSAPAHVLSLSPTKAKDADREQINVIAKQALGQADDPWFAKAGFKALWEQKSPDIVDDWTEIQLLSQFQKGRLKEVVSIDVACSIMGGCGPENPWTLEYCAIMTSTQCPVGSSFDQIASLNLSQVELDLRKRILTNISSHYPH